MDQEIQVPEGGIRLDRFLARQFPGYSRVHWKEQVSRGGVLVDGEPRPADYGLRGGETISIRAAACAWKDAPIEDWVVFEDRDVLVLDKPAGLLMHPVGESWLRTPEACWSEAEPNLAGLLLSRRPGISTSGTPRCGIVHRLDRGTSGLLVVAKTPEAYARLTKAFADRRVDKTYRAIVHGALDRSVDVEAPIGGARPPGRRKLRVSPWGKRAATAFRVIETAESAALVEARPKTGRTHQIRAHLAHIRHPVFGDPEWDRSADRSGLPEPPRMMLHAWRLSFMHPRTGKKVEFRAFAPKDFRDYWKRLRAS